MRTLEPPRHQDTKVSEPASVPAALDDIGRDIVDAAYKVHVALGPGLLESVYQQCLTYELERRGRLVSREVPVPLIYDEVRLESGLRLDMIVDESIIIELKAVERLLPLHEAQLLTYLKLARKRLGFLINFNVPRIKEGIRRLAL
jgi:GxxExxY protein